MIRALFFDAAGTLIEPAEPVAETYARWLSPHLGPLDPRALAAGFSHAFKACGEPAYAEAGDGDLAERAWWRNVVESTVGQQLPDEAFDALFDHFASAEAWTVFPDVRSVLAQLPGLGLKAAVVSNFDLRLHRILSECHLADAFELIVTSAEARSRKPDPALFRQALQHLDLEPEQVRHVGDSPHADGDGARAAGIQAYLLQRPTRGLSHFLDWVRDQKGI